MTTITGKAGIGGGIAPSALGPNKSYLLVRSVEVVTTLAGTTIQPYAARHELNTDGTFSITVEALPDGFAYEFVFNLNGGEHLSAPRICEVPASGSVQYKDLVDVVPIDHTGYGAPGWLLEILAGGGGGGEGGGADGQSPELRASGGYIQWKLPSATSWNNLVALADLKGADGLPGSPGNPGTPGQEVSLQLTATHIQWRLGTGSWSNLVALADLKGAKGDPGNEVSLQLTATHIQWRLGTGSWSNLVALADLKGAKGDPGDPGDSVELQVTATHIQWRSGTDAWADLIALADLKGEPGEPGSGGGGSATFASLGGTPDENPALAAALDLKFDKSAAELMVMRVYHGGDQWFPRPDVPNPLDWAGWVEPVYMIDGKDFYCVLAEPADSFTGAFDSFGVPRFGYSLRRMLTAYTGPLIRVRRSSDGTELDIAATADGDLDSANLLAFAGAGSAFVVTWYDQSNNGRHITNATQAAQPRIVNAGALEVNAGKAKVVFDGSNDYLAGAFTGLYVAGATTLSMVHGFAADTADTVFGEVGDTNANSYRLARIGAGSASPLWRGSITASPTGGWSLAAPAGDLTFDGNLRHLFVVDSGTQLWQYQDQIERLAGVTATRGSTPTLTRTTLGAAAYNTPSGFATGFVQELIAWGSDERDDRVAISDASKSYWGTP